MHEPTVLSPVRNDFGRHYVPQEKQPWSVGSVWGYFTLQAENASSRRSLLLTLACQHRSLARLLSGNFFTRVQSLQLDLETRQSHKVTFNDRLLKWIYFLERDLIAANTSGTTLGDLRPVPDLLLKGQGCTKILAWRAPAPWGAESSWWASHGSPWRHPCGPCRLAHVSPMSLLLITVTLLLSRCEPSKLLFK